MHISRFQIGTTTLGMPPEGPFLALAGFPKDLECTNSGKITSSLEFHYNARSV